MPGVLESSGDVEKLPLNERRRAPTLLYSTVRAPTTPLLPVMKRAFENSCIKGCAIYLVVLLAILVAGAAGVGGFSARFGASSPMSQGGGQPSGAQPPAQAPSAVPTSETPAEPQATPPGQTVIVINPPAQAPIPTATDTPAPAREPTPAPPAPADVEAPTPPQSSYAPQVQAQDGEIKGQASQPFYIVQSNDTLSGIASRFSTTVEALRQANKLADVNSIWPGQLLYLPQGTEAAPGPQSQTGGQGDESPAQGGPGPLPLMPDTGINAGH